MIHKDEVINHPHYPLYPVRHIYWTAIFAGALVGIGLAFLLNLFGLAIGLSAFTLTNTGAKVLAVGGFLGILISVIVSMFMAGYTAGYLGRACCPHPHLGVIYGFTTWTLALIFSALISSHISHYVTAYTNAGSPTVSVTADAQTDKTSVLTVESTPTTSKVNQKNIQVTASQSSVVWAAFSMFILFFVGAFASCVGAYCAMTCKRCEEHLSENQVPPTIQS